MANIHVSRGQTKLGIFSQEEIKEGLQSGRFVATDLGWREGMSSWSPLSQFPEFAAASPLTPTGGTSAPSAATGLPWDHRERLGFLPAFFETLKLVLLEPGAAFSSMQPEGGLGPPLLYAVIGGCVGFAFNLLFSILFGSLGLLGHRDPFAGLLGLGFTTVVFVICFPIMLLLGLFLWSAILHLCLTMLGSAKRSFETTFRVVCFSCGSTYPLMIVPICGGGISTVWCIVAECIGLAKSHETDTGRAVLAVFLPVIVCCGGGVALAVMFGALGALTGHH